MNGDAVKILGMDEVRARFQQNGADPAPSTPQQFLKLMQDEQLRVKKIVQEIGLKAQY